MDIRRSRGWAAGLLVVWMLAGCKDKGSAPPVVESPPFDVQKVMARVHFAFRPAGVAWEGGHDTYAVRVEADGFSVKPYHHPGARPEEARALASASAEPPPPGPVLEGEAVRFGAARVVRGGGVLSDGTARARVDEEGGLVREQGGVIEYLRNGEEGTEQGWRFLQRPEGTGPLEVRLPVEGGRFLGETQGGVHFASGPSGLGVRYGHGTWVDAGGRRTAIPARFDAGHLVLRVPAEVLQASEWPAVLGPTVSPEFGMNAPVFGAFRQSQQQPSVAYDGTNYLVVWQDLHTDNNDIYGARVTSAGTPLEGAGIAISTAANHQSAPQVAYDGTNFLVVWQDARAGSSIAHIYGARVERTGTVLEPDGIPISTTANNQTVPALASGKAGFLVVWQDSRAGSGNNDIYGARVDGTGTVLEPNGIPITTAASNQNAPAVASDGTDFLVVWHDSRVNGLSWDLYGARVDSTGAVRDASGIPISTATANQTQPAVAYDGTQYLVVWSDSRRSSASDIYGARVSRAGAVLDTSGIVISTAPSAVRPAVGHDGSQFLVVWSDYRGGSDYDAYGARVDGAGVVLDPSGIAISTAPLSQFNVELASGGGQFLVAWTDQRSNNGQDVHAARVRNGTVLDSNGLLLSTEANEQGCASVAYDGTNFLVVWHELRDSLNASFEVYGARVDGTGTLLDAHGLNVATGTGQQYCPRVAYDGTNFLVVWHDSRGGSTFDIYGTRVSSAGTVLDGSGFPISVASGDQTYPDVAQAGNQFLVVWTDTRSGTGDVYGARVSNAGKLLDTNGIAISTAANGQSSPKVASDGTRFLVVWQDSRASSPHIHGARVDGTGSVLDSGGILISTHWNSQFQPAVASDGTRFLVVWQDYRNNYIPDIYGARVDAAGALLDSEGIAISKAANTQSFPRLVHDGTGFLVVWEDTRAGNTDIYGARVSGSGDVRDGNGFPISAEPLKETMPALVSAGGGKSLVVYQRFVASPSYTHRILARFLQAPPNTPPEAVPQDVSADEDTALLITLNGTDVDGDSLTYTVGNPSHGTLTGTAPNLTYTPEANFHGSDGFTFTVADSSGATSSPATVRITVVPVNDAPVAQSQTLSMGQEATPLSLGASDVDGDALTFRLERLPTGGSLTGSPPEVEYTPPPDFRGTVSFTFTASDGKATSEPATVTLHVGNGAPRVAISASTLKPLEGESVVFTSRAEDPGGDTLTYAWRFGDGTTSEEPHPSHAYVNEGAYEVVLTVSDGVDSVQATLTLEVLNAAPILVPFTGPAAAEEGKALTFQASATDSGASDVLSYTWDFGDGSPAAVGAQVTHTYADDGTFIVKVSVRDDAGASTEASREVQVSNLPPVPTPVPAQHVGAGQELRVQLEAWDAAGEKDPLTWRLLEGPGTLTPEGLYTWTPSAKAGGSFLVRAQVSDDEGGSAEAIVSIIVTSPGGCGCTGTGEATSASALLLFALAASARRRVRRAC